MGDHRRAVVVQDGFDVGDAGQDGLGAASEASEEVRLDKAGQDAHRGFHVSPVDPHRPASPVSSGLDQALIVPGVVLNDAISADYLAPQHAHQFGLGLGAVSAQGVDQHDPLVGHAGQGQLVQQRRQHPIVGHGAGQIAEHHGHRVVRPHQIAQGQRARRRAQRSRDSGPLVGQARHELRLDDGHRRVFGQLNPQPLTPIGQL